MSVNRSPNDPLFDEFAENYDEALNQGISVSGEDKEYFARKRVEWLGACLAEIGMKPRRVLDFGCGTGSSTPFLLGLPGAEKLVGIDVSPKALEVARRVHGSDRAQFQVIEDYRGTGEVDLAFCTGVFHHIPPEERPGSVKLIWEALRPGGILAFWENNPWNPGTRYVMSRIPFDRDAITLSPPESRRLLRAGGFEDLRLDFLFIFPRALGFFRRLEPTLSRLPLGAQYQVLVRKPQ